MLVLQQARNNFKHLQKWGRCGRRLLPRRCLASLWGCSSCCLALSFPFSFLCFRAFGSLCWGGSLSGSSAFSSSVCRSSGSSALRCCVSFVACAFGSLRVRSFWCRVLRVRGAVSFRLRRCRSCRRVVSPLAAALSGGASVLLLRGLFARRASFSRSGCSALGGLSPPLKYTSQNKSQ